MTNSKPSASLYASVPTERPGVTMSFRAYADHAAMIHDAARTAGISTARSVSRVAAGAASSRSRVRVRCGYTESGSK